MRKSAAALVFVLGTWLHYEFARSIVSVNVENCRECHSPDEFHILKTEGEQALVLQNLMGEPELASWSYTGPLGAMVSVFVEKGRLDAGTRQHLELFLKDIPDAPQAISFITRSGAGASKTFVNLSLHRLPDTPNALRILPAFSPGYEQPDFRLAADGLSMSIEIGLMASVQPGASNADYELRIGDWTQKLAGIPVTILAEAGASVEFRYASVSWEPDGSFTPFEFQSASQKGSGGGYITASSGGLRVLGPGAESFDRYLCGAPQAAIMLTGSAGLKRGECPPGKTPSPLRLSALKLGKEYVQIAVSGSAWAQHHGDPVTLDLIAWLKTNPYLALLLGSLDAAVLAWIKGVFSGKAKTGETKA